MQVRSDYNTLLDAEIASVLDSGTSLLSSQNARLIRCPLCDSDEKQHKTLFFKRGFKFVLCPGCGLIFTNPMIKSEINGLMYENAGSFKEWGGNSSNKFSGTFRFRLI